jgi:hypothetical protein
MYFKNLSVAKNLPDAPKNPHLKRPTGQFGYFLIPFLAQCGFKHRDKAQFQNNEVTFFSRNVTIYFKSVTQFYM